MGISIDGTNLKITLTSISSYSVEEIYSTWKRWAILPTNLGYPPAFDILGGDPIGAGQTVASFFFIRNDLGWCIQAPEASGTINISGNLFGRAQDREIFDPPAGPYTVVFSLVVTSKGTVTVVPVGSGLSTAQASSLTMIERILRNKMITDPTSGDITVYDDDGVTILLTASLFEDAAGAQRYRGQGAERRERLT